MSNDHDKLLPIANVGRIMKQILPQSGKISKEAKERMQECATEFICFVTSEASDRCHKENRKTLNGDDICWALSTLGFDDYCDAMLRYLHRFREVERQRANQSNKIMASSSTTHEDKDEGTTSTYSTTSGAPSSFDFPILEKGGTSSTKRS